MKILYHHRIASRDGQFVHIESIVAALKSRGHSVALVGPSVPRRSASGEASAAVSFFKRVLPRSLYEFLEILYGIFDYWRLAKSVRSCRPELLYERYNLYTIAGMLLKSRCHVPFLLEVNAPLYSERLQYGGLGWPMLARWSERLIWRSADAILTVTHVLAHEIAASGVPSHKISVVPNAVSLTALQDVPNTEAAKGLLGLTGRRVLGFVGFVRDWHGLDQVIAWLDERGPPDVILVVVGGGPALSQLKDEALRRGIGDQFLATGTVAHEIVPKYVAAFDIALQPAVVPYASPLKLFEYMAMARAIIAPDTANIREIVTHAHDAWLVSPQEFPEAINHLLSDDILRSHLGREARKTVERLNLTWDRNAERIEGVWRSVIAERRRVSSR